MILYYLHMILYYYDTVLFTYDTVFARLDPGELNYANSTNIILEHKFCY